jgi:hypothetical protein
MPQSFDRTATRREVADAVEALLSNVISYNEFLERVPEDTEDDAIAEVLDLIEHIPRNGGLFGVDANASAGHLHDVLSAARRLRADAHE